MRRYILNNSINTLSITCGCKEGMRDAKSVIRNP